MAPITLSFGQDVGFGPEMGTDVGVPVGTPVVSPFSGTFSSESAGQTNWGDRAFVDLGNGLTYAVGHLTQFAKNPGDLVNAGDVIGYSGGAIGDPQSGVSTGPHVEFQFLDQGQFIDPQGVLQQLGLSFDQLFQPGTVAPGFGGAVPPDVGGGGLDPVAVAQQALQAGFSPASAQYITAIAGAETGGSFNPFAVGDQGSSFGLTQVNLPSHPEFSTANLFDPLTNLQAAFQISGGGQDFTPWTTFNTGAYGQYFDQAGQAVQQALGGVGGVVQDIGSVSPVANLGLQAGGAASGTPGGTGLSLPPINIQVPGLQQISDVVKPIGDLAGNIEREAFRSAFVLAGVALIGLGIIVMLQSSQGVQKIEIQTARAATSAVAAG